MKLYDCASAPSPRRVRIFLAEKGMVLPVIQVDLRSGEHLQPAFKAINPDSTVPVLELDDGTRLTDSVAICEYIEAIHPEPALLGTDARDKALVSEWQRRVERDGLYAMMEAFRNFTPGFKNRALTGKYDYEQIPALAERGRVRIGHFFTTLEERLALTPFVAGPRFTIADITALITVDFGKWVKLAIPEDCPNLKRWYETVSARPSAKA